MPSAHSGSDGLLRSGHRICGAPPEDDLHGCHSLVLTAAQHPLDRHAVYMAILLPVDTVSSLLVKPVLGKEEMVAR